jgi:hypothetical protein
MEDIVFIKILIAIVVTPNCQSLILNMHYFVSHVVAVTLHYVVGYQKA